MSGSHLSRDFFELVKAIGESKSKQVRAILRAACALARGERPCSGRSIAATAEARACRCLR
jgi:hypothetical protein